VWVKLGGIWGENRRKPVFGFRLSGGKGILQRSQTVNAEKNTQIGYNPDKHTQGQQHGSLARSKIH
ncbi:TPA: hypothetical protein ACJCPP_002112, partial [Neisseria meningitidis]